VRHSACGLRR